ncbi:glycosyltransferase [Porphyromonas sp. CAG:1061]|uniref:beta-1,6-N-acetylglucosaminyltransferase n=1 Tax=Porphyromonas sp. CAG:1061 TaxID=1262916 RepID=UPI00033E6ED5|nr:beta-1,6-N-acetylglucosaminyltransferase [Porphyromonas sp. CAG:1061]CCY12337.1 glycosyltransferase [Porphyromonas sp. CAG:1061]
MGFCANARGRVCLLRAATSRDSYQYFHLISGADLPLKSQDEIHAFFSAHQGQEFIGYSQYDYSKEVMGKVHRYHLFDDHFKGKGPSFFLMKATRS